MFLLTIVCFDIPGSFYLPPPRLKVALVPEILWNFTFFFFFVVYRQFIK